MFDAAKAGDHLAVEAGQVLIDVITKYYHKFAKIIGDNKAKVVLAKLGNDAGIYGAARMVLK